MSQLILKREIKIEKEIFNAIDTKFDQFKSYIEYEYYYHYLALYEVIFIVIAAINEFGNSINQNRKGYSGKGS